MRGSATSDSEPRARLLLSAREEFLAHGFERASLRRICGKAGVTTGAVYFFFQGKEDLFVHLVKDTAERLTQLGRDLALAELETPDIGPSCDMQLMAFLYRHREEALLLLEKAQGTCFAGFSQAFFAQVRHAFALFFQRYGAEDVDLEMPRLLAEMRIQGILELLRGDYTMDRILELTRLTGIYADGGFRALAADLQRQQKNG